MVLDLKQDLNLQIEMDNKTRKNTNIKIEENILNVCQD